MPIQTIQMFARPITREDDQQLIRVIQLGNLYYRRLAEIENEFRQATRAIGEEYEGIGTILQQIRDLSPEDRKGEPGDRLRASLKEGARRRSADPQYRSQAQALTQRMHDAKRRARGESGLAPGAWGTYQRIEQHHEFACSMTHWSEDVDPNRPPGIGQVAVHVQGRNLTYADLLEHNWNYCQIDADHYALGRSVDGYARRSTGPGDWGPSRRMDRPETQPAQRMREIRIRCDSNGRIPVWARMHLLDTGKIPEGGKISWIWAQRDRVGLRFRWKLTVVVETHGPIYAPVPTAETVAVDLRCGRRVEGGRLLAHAAGSDGAQYSLVLPDVRATTRGGKPRSTGCIDTGKIADLRSIRDKCLNAAIHKIRDFAQALPEAHPLREETQHAHAWRRWGRIAAFTHRLEQAIEPPEIAAAIAAEAPSSSTTSATPTVPTAPNAPTAQSPPAPIPEAQVPAAHALVANLRADLKQDRHLFHWQAHQEDKLVRRTRARVQQWCAMLTEKYAAIAFEDLSIKDLKEQDTPLGHVVARGIQAMAPGRVRQAAEQAANKRGRTFLKVDYRNTTRACATCGHLRDGDLSADLVTCERCGTASPPWVTAATNILHRASEELRATRAALLEDRSSSSPQKRTLLRRNRKKKPEEITRE